jgi:hypothetical protein
MSAIALADSAGLDVPGINELTLGCNKPGGVDIINIIIY